MKMFCGDEHNKEAVAEGYRAMCADIRRAQCPPNISLPVGLKEVQTQLVSFCVTQILRTPSTLKPQDEVFVRY